MNTSSLYNGKATGYYENIREDIINLITDRPNKILEIGCGKGYTLKKLKELGKAGEIVGIEMDTNSAEEAKAYLDGITCCNIEEILSLPFDRGYFDYIILADILEHLSNPWKTLRVMRDYLNEKGSIIATIPNLRHKSIVLPLILRGKFQYDPDGGLMDITHLRFFTRESVTSLFKTSGYSKVYFVDYPISFKARVVAVSSLGFLRDFFIPKFRVIAAK